MKFLYQILFSCVFLLSFVFSGTLSSETPQEKLKRMEWWHEAKFGLFIHFGIYAIPGKGEWYMRVNKVPLAEYAKLTAQFNPTLFDADLWMEAAHEAGMKYVVVTSKHHDGFCMFHTNVDGYNVVDATPFKRDVIKEISDAASRHSMRFGVYYSAAADWHHPGGGVGCPHWDSGQDGNNQSYLDHVAVPQVRELLSNYGPVSELWFDTDGASMTQEGARELDDLLALQPEIITNNRLRGYPGDFDTPEQHIGPLRPKRDQWEACTTMTGGWGYSNKPAKSPTTLIRQLIDIASKGGNELLNIGPQPDGQFPADNLAVLKAFGAWLKINGEAIYGSDGGPFDYLSWGRCTRKGNTLYFHVFDWPKDGLLHIPMDVNVIEAHLIADPSKQLSHELVNGKVVLHLPPTAPDPIASVIVVKVASNPQHLHSLALNKTATASAYTGNRVPSNAVDDDPKTRWTLNPGTSGWLQVDLQAPMTFNTVRVSHSIGDFKVLPIREFSLEYLNGTEWKPIFTDKDMPIDEYVRSFPPVTAQIVRLNIQKADTAIDVASFELFAPEN